MNFYMLYKNFKNYIRLLIKIVNLFLFKKDLFIFREGEQKGEREGDKCQLVASLTPQQGTEPATWARALTSDPLGVCRMMPNQLSHTGQG